MGSEGGNRYTLDMQPHVHNKVPFQITCHTDILLLCKLGPEQSQQLHRSCRLAGVISATLKGHPSLESNKAAV